MMNTAISDAEQLYWSIFESVSDGVLILDLETGSVQTANPAVCSMHGYTREDFIGLLPSGFIHPGSQKMFKNQFQAFRSGSVFNVRLTHVRRDSTTFLTEWSGTEFTYQGRACLLGVVRDVSKRIRAEQRLQQRIIAHTREQSKLLEISHTLASTLEFQPELILDQLH
ncbi:MAG: PAS domain S-box protein, partial [Anaerolineales bacterium]|nr:PAS domain S-box protein [Anaerolineales bacterium]